MHGCVCMSTTCQGPACTLYECALICVMRHAVSFVYDVTGDCWATGPGLECSQAGFVIAAALSLAVIWMRSIVSASDGGQHRKGSLLV